MGLENSGASNFDDSSHELMGGDVGESRREEIDRVTRGGNYGWPRMEGDTAFRPDRSSVDTLLQAPVAVYSHAEGICVIGGEVYRGSKIPALYGKYIFADFKSKLFALTSDKSGHWSRQPLKIVNLPKSPLLICNVNSDRVHDMYLMAISNESREAQGVVYRLVQ